VGEETAINQRPELSVQLYSVRESFAAEPMACLQRLREIGFRCVEPFGLPNQEPSLRAGLLEMGLTAPTAHGSVLEKPAAAIEQAVTLGVKTLIDPYQPRENFESLSSLRRLADDLSAAASLAQSSGLRLGYHNHDHELTAEIQGRPALLVLAEETSESVLFEVDLFWCQIANVSPTDVLSSLGNRVIAVHAKDAPAGGGVLDQVPLGQGNVRLLESFAAAPSARIIVEFDEYAGDLFEAIAQSYEYLVAEGVS
jgi:sugar phosphate isomerase/epimerase